LVNKAIDKMNKLYFLKKEIKNFIFLFTTTFLFSKIYVLQRNRSFTSFKDMVFGKNSVSAAYEKI